MQYVSASYFQNYKGFGYLPIFDLVLFGPNFSRTALDVPRLIIQGGTNRQLPPFYSNERWTLSSN
jgi:hypothetical protein